MPGGFDYFNARIRGMMGRLLPEERLREALTVPDAGGWLDLLRGTPYEPFLLGASPSTETGLLYEAVDRGVAARTGPLPRRASGGSVPAVEILLGEWDLPNLTAVMAGVFRHDRPSDVLASTLAGGLLTAVQLGELARSRNLREAADRLATWSYPYHLAYRAALGRRKETPSLTGMRLALVRAFVSQLAERSEHGADPVLPRFIKARIDHLNLGTALLGSSLPLDRSPDSFFLPGGKVVDLVSFHRVLSASSPEEAVGTIPPPYRRGLQAALIAREAENRLSVFPQALDRTLFLSFTRSTALDPLGASLLLAFLLRLRREGVILKLGLTRLALGAPAEAFLTVVGDV